MAFISRKRTAGLTIAICFCILMIILFGCTRDIYHGKRPCDYPNTTWKCIDPELSLVVNKDRTVAFVVHNEEVEHPDLCVGFTYGSRMDVFTQPEGEMYFRCDCKFYKNKMVAKVIEDKLFEGKYEGKKIVFYRQDQ